MSTLNQDNALMMKIDHAATLEKASKIQSERGLHLYNAQLSADQRTQSFLESNKEKASSIHVDVRGASTQLSNRLNKNITILETRRLKLRRDESGQKISNNTTIKAINELRLEKLSFDRIFENIKQEIEEVNQQITDTFVIANKSYSKQVKTRKAIDQLLQEEREEKIMHLNNIEKFDNIVRQTIQNAKKAEKKIHKDMLEEKKERRLAKQRANNTFSRSKHDEPTEKKSRKQTYSRGDLSDDQERLIREKVANLEDEVKKAAAIYSAAQGNSEKVKLSQEKTLATLHTLRHARQQLQLSSRQVQQHTERKISTISTDELEIIMNDKHTVPKIISAWKSNEKNIFGLVKQVQEMNDQILSVSTETRWLNSKTVELQSSSASQDSLKNDMALRRRNDLMEVKDKNTLVLKETNVLKNEIDQLCTLVENMLESTNMTSTKKSKQYIVRPYTLPKMSGVMEQRAIDIMNAYRVWEEMAKDELFMASAKYAATYLPPLSKHKKYKQKFGPSVPKSPFQKRRRPSRLATNGGGGSTVDPPLLMTYASHETRPLTLKETRLIMSM